MLEATRAEDRAEARIATLRKSVLAVFTVRGIAVDHDAHERITGEGDPERLERWLARAITASVVSEVIETE